MWKKDIASTYLSSLNVQAGYEMDVDISSQGAGFIQRGARLEGSGAAS
jgi:hypothetical protein